MILGSSFKQSKIADHESVADVGFFKLVFLPESIYVAQRAEAAGAWCTAARVQVFPAFLWQRILSLISISAPPRRCGGELIDIDSISTFEKMGSLCCELHSRTAVNGTACR